MSPIATVLGGLKGFASPKKSLSLKLSKGLQVQERHLVRHQNLENVLIFHVSAWVLANVHRNLHLPRCFQKALAKIHFCSALHAGVGIRNELLQLAKRRSVNLIKAPTKQILIHKLSVHSQ